GQPAPRGETATVPEALGGRRRPSRRGSRFGGEAREPRRDRGFAVLGALSILWAGAHDLGGGCAPPPVDGGGGPPRSVAAGNACLRHLLTGADGCNGTNREASRADERGKSVWGGKTVISCGTEVLHDQQDTHKRAEIGRPNEAQPHQQSMP